MKPLLLQVSALNVQAGRFALQNISFSLEMGAYFIILGPTGCGKTMLLETLAGLRKPVSGKILLKGKDITYFPPEERGLGFAYQDSLLYPFLNVKENILFGAKAGKKGRDVNILKRMDRLAEAMGISHLLPRYPSALSGGEKQRVSLARAILTNPPLLLLDEPLSALDPQTRDSMRTLLQEIHQAEGMGIIHVTHDFNEALQLGTQALVMNNGNIQQQGDPLTVFEKPGSLFVAGFLQSENIVKGIIEREGGSPWFKNVENDLSLGPLPEDLLRGNMPNEVYLVIHAGQIEVSCGEEFCDQRTNSWTALVEKAIINSSHVDLTCKGKGCWHVTLSRHEWQSRAMDVGSKVKLSVKMERIHLISNS